MTEQLKPCPFCGSKARKGSGYYFHKVGCSNEECFMYGEFQYLERWQNRPYENKIKADAVMSCLAFLQNYLSAVDLSDTACNYIEEYADKLERGE